MMEDEDDFLYGAPTVTPGTSNTPAPVAETTAGPIEVSQPSPIETALATNGLVSHLEQEAANQDQQNSSADSGAEQDEDQEQSNAEDEEEEQEEESDEDIEIIMEPTSRTLDLRQQNRALNRTVGSSQPPPARPAPAPVGPAGTTEYTPLQRGLPPSASVPSVSATPAQHIPPSQSVPASTQFVPQPQAAPSLAPAPAREPSPLVDDGIDTSKLPPATAPASHPPIDPAAVGHMDGRSILDVDLSALADKPWRKPGSDISDWFNYGFDEISWEAYCYRRRDVGDLAHVLKASVLNFAGLEAEQVTNLPPEARQMVMTGTNTFLNNMNNGGQMMGMMDMGMMNPMMDMGMMQGMMPEGGQGPNGTPEPMMQDGYAGGMMGGDYGMQEGQMNYAMESSPSQVPQQASRGATPAFRGRGAPPTGPSGLRGGRGGFARGRGGRPSYEAGGIQRPVSPLPSNVPTGPRNQNKYKDRDNNAPAVDGLDYGRTPSGEPEDRSRKRRGSPNIDDLRSSKRR